MRSPESPPNPILWLWVPGSRSARPGTTVESDARHHRAIAGEGAASLHSQLPPSLDVAHVTGIGVDIDFHPAASPVTPLDLPFVAEELGVGNGSDAEAGRSVERGLHRDLIAGIIGKRRRRRPDRERHDDRQDETSHGTTPVELPCG